MTVYLIHFDQPIGDLSNPRGQAQHYVGSCDDLAARIARHRAGNGSAIMAYVSQAGIAWQVARCWEGGRTTERRIKARKNARALCPICSGEIAYRRATHYSEKGN